MKRRKSHRLATHLKLPVGRLEKLLRLICGAASRQNKLVDHDLMPEFVHIYRHDRFLLDAQSLQSRKQNQKKWKCCLGRHLGTVGPSAASISDPWVSSAAFSSNNNIFMSSLTTKIRLSLIGQRVCNMVLRDGWLVIALKGLKFRNAFVSIVRNTVDEWLEYLRYHPAFCVHPVDYLSAFISGRYTNRSASYCMFKHWNTQLIGSFVFFLPQVVYIFYILYLLIMVKQSISSYLPCYIWKSFSRDSFIKETTVQEMDY